MTQKERTIMVLTDLESVIENASEWVFGDGKSDGRYVRALLKALEYLRKE